MADATDDVLESVLQVAPEEQLSFPKMFKQYASECSAHYQVAPIRPMNHVEYAMCGFAMAILVDAKLATRGRYAGAA